MSLLLSPDGVAVITMDFPAIVRSVVGLPFVSKPDPEAEMTVRPELSAKRTSRSYVTKNRPSSVLLMVPDIPIRDVASRLFAVHSP
jgi:hypothetical protein